MKYELKAKDIQGRELSVFSPSYEGTFKDALKWFSTRDFIQNNPSIASIEIVPKKEPAIVLLLDSARGTHIPQNFAELALEAGNNWQGYDSDDIECLLAGDTVENDWYWEAWDSVLQSAEFILMGDKYTLHLGESGDLWAVCFERMTEEEKENFGFETED